MKRASLPRLLRSGTGWMCKKETFTIPKTLPDDGLSGQEKTFKVSLTGELQPFEIKSEKSNRDGHEFDPPEPSVEVHFRPSDEAEEATLLPIYEVVVSSESGSEQVQLLGAGSCVENEALLCLADPQEEQEAVEGFQEFTDAVSTSELCRICACASQDLIPIFGDEGEQLELAGKIIRHLPITVCEADRLPLHVCETCVAQINMCHELVRICGEADIRLRLMLDQEDRQKDNQAMSVLNIPKIDVLDEESIEQDMSQAMEDDTVRSWSPEPEPLPEEEVVETILPEICPTKTQQSQITQGVIQDGKKSKFKVVVVKLTNSSNTLTKEAQIAKALAMIKSGDQNKQQNASNKDPLSDGEDQGNWDGEGGILEREQWSTHPFICSLCNETVTGASNFMQHQRDIHDILMYHCNTCNSFYDSSERLQQHKIEQHSSETSDNVKITNVAEIQLLNSNKLTSNSNLCMKVSKDFDKMDKSLRSKIVGAIQDIVLQDQSTKNQCEICKDNFNTKEALNKHCKELQHKITRPINCSLCKKTFKNYLDLQQHKLSSHDDLKSFTCNYCEMKFLTKRMLLRHISGHSEYKAFTCNTCGKGYNSKSGFEIHLSTHNTEKPYLCDLCGKSFKHVSNLKGHKRSHLSEEDKKRHGCPYCEKRFRCKFLVDEHMRSHTGERPFACDICNKRFYKRQQLKQHTLVHSNDSYECHICNSRFNRRGNLTEHIKKHMTLRRYSCKVCKEGFETVSQLVAHRKTHTTEEIAQSKLVYDNITETGASSYQCSVCNKVLATRISLESHLRIHTGEKPFECEYCGQKFSQKPALTYHRRRHTGEKPFTCSYCNEGFLSRNAKNIHERIHTGEKPYSCYVCGSAFRCASSLTQHLAVHSDQRPFSCPHCSKCFRRREAMQIHLRIHTGEKPYPCEICGRAFTQKGDMVKHRRTHVNDKPHECKLCDFITTSRKELKKHEALHQIDSDSILIASENLITSFPEITIVGQECEMILEEEADIVDQISQVE